MKQLMENWRGYLQEIDWAERNAELDDGEETNKYDAEGNKKSVSGRLGSLIAKGWNAMDDYLKKDHCEKKFPELLKKKGDIQTFGELHALLMCTLQYKNRKKALGILAGFVPGIAAAKEVFDTSQEVSDFVLGMYQVPDGQRPEGNLGKLDMDDEVSAMISDKVEKMFVTWLIESIGSNENLDKDIPSDWSVTDQLRDYLTTKNAGRTVTGYENEA